MNPGRLKAIELADLKPGEKVLEVGVGTGLSLPFYPATVEVRGIDLSSKMLDRAKKLVAQEDLSYVKELSIMNAEAMTFADNSFDCVMAMHVSTVVGDPGKFGDELRRVCKPNGRIIIVNYFHNPEGGIGRFSGLIEPYAQLVGFRPDLTLAEFLRRSKMEVEKTAPVNLFHLHDVLLIRNTK